MIGIEEVKEILKKRLTEKRYNHSIGAMKAAKELAIIYGENERQAEFTGLIHDIAKEMPKEEIEEYIKKCNIEVDEIEKNQIGLLHAKLGASIAKEEFGANEKIQNAIKYHTTGNIKMDTFAKIIYIADKIEENRTYEEVEHLRELAKQDLDKAILYILDFTTTKSIKKGKLIHPDSINLRNYLLTLDNSQKLY
ncbi:MAG: bis(5'-nucleosyl)-tetraphosphatase (symmetrical) YqeK [Clostridia bacterium]|nr:bis(5'-nucleosyl)-tetraphosphatase (symmetrical) YqeK [Clostridia bacterium]